MFLAVLWAGSVRSAATRLGLERDVLGRDTALEGRSVLSVPPQLVECFLMPDLARFAAQHPGIQIELVTTYDLAKWSDREADIAIRFPDCRLRWIMTHSDQRATERVRVLMRFIADALTARRDKLLGGGAYPPYGRLRGGSGAAG